MVGCAVKLGDGPFEPLILLAIVGAVPKNTEPLILLAIVGSVPKNTLSNSNSELQLQLLPPPIDFGGGL